MAVVQISRIQIRRGKRNSGTGLPQLASGELAWALDTQELYIGNGAVSEGAPAVGNTKVLTELDLNANGNLLNLLQHIYKVTDTGMRTGPTVNNPTSRSLQERFDDRVTAQDFGVKADGSTDDTVALQRAIDQLFLNATRTESYIDTADGVSTRVVLNLPSGIIKITGTLYIPSYATLIGAGSGKTIISSTSTNPIVRFVNDDSVAGSPATLTGTDYDTQPKNIHLKGISFVTSSATQVGLKLDAVRDSVFEDLSIEGDWTGVYSANSRGIEMNAVSSVVTCERNVFNHIKINGFVFGVYARQDIHYNSFTECWLYNVRHGFILGARPVDGSGTLGDADGSTPGEQYGPRNTTITNCIFGDNTYGVKRHAVYLGIGSNNSIINPRLTNVGNEGGGHLTAEYPQIYFNAPGNTAECIETDRHLALSNPQPGGSLQAVPYVPEVSGDSVYKSYGVNTINIAELTNFDKDAILIRLPVATNGVGTPRNSITYTFDYSYHSTSLYYTRKGTMSFTVFAEDKLGHPPSFQLSDDFVTSGIAESEAVKLEFRVRLLNQTGDYISSGEDAYSIIIEYKNAITGDTGVLSYSYTATV